MSNRFLVILEATNRDAKAVRAFLDSRGTYHQILDNVFYFSTDQAFSPVELRDTILQESDDGRIFIVRFEGDISAAWRLSTENSNWLKDNL